MLNLKIKSRKKHWFWSEISKYSRLYRYIALSAVIINVFALTGPLFIMNVYDRVLPSQALVTGWVLGIGALTIYAFDFMIRSIRTTIMDRISTDVDKTLSAKIFEKLMKMRLAERPKSSGVMASMLREFDSVREFFSASSIITLIDLPFAFFFLLIIAFLSGWIAVLIFCIMMLMFASGFILNLKLMPYISKSLQYTEKRHGVLVETIQGLETLKSLGGGKRLLEAYTNAVEGNADTNYKTRRLSAMQSHIVTGLQQAMSVLIILIGMYGVKDQNLTIGALIACVILSGRAMSPMTQAAGLIIRYNQIKLSLDALNRFMQKDEDRHEGQEGVRRTDIKGDIRFEKVSFTYPHAKNQILDQVSFDIKAGEKIGIIGRIGSGKSTIARLLMNLYDPDNGSILIDGTDHRQIDLDDLQTQVGYIAQDVKLLSGTINENILLGVEKVDEKRLEAIIKETGIADFASRHPLGFDAQVGEGGLSLSGGQRQTIALARALLLAPKILICDEPTNAMDLQTEQLFMQLIKKYCPKTTVILITHRQSLLSLVDRLILIEKGHAVMDDKRDKVLKALSEGKIEVRR